MANKSEVKVTLSLKDNASKKLATFDKGLGKLRKSAISTAKTLLSNKFGLLALAGTFAYAIKVQAKYETSLTNVRNLTGLTDAEFYKMKNTITDMSSSSSKSLLDLSEAMFDVQSAGFLGAQATDVLRDSMTLAVAGATTTKIAVDGVTGILNVYGDVIKNSKDASELLFATQQKGKTTVDKVSTSFGKYGATAKSLGVSITEALGSIAEMTVQNIKADEASTKLVATMTGFANASREQIEIAKLYNIELGTEALRNKGLLKIIGQISEAKKENADIVQLLFKGNVELSSGVNALITNYKRLIKTEEAIRTSSGAVDKAYSESAKTLEFKYNKAINKAHASMEKLYKFWQKTMVFITGSDTVKKLKKAGFDFHDGLKVTEERLLKAEKALERYTKARRNTRSIRGGGGIADAKRLKERFLNELDDIFVPLEEKAVTTEVKNNVVTDTATATATDTTDTKGTTEKVDRVAIETSKNREILKSAVDTFSHIDELRAIDLKSQIDGKKQILEGDVHDFVGKLSREEAVYNKKKEYLDKETEENRTELTAFLESLDIKDEADLEYFEARLERMDIIRDKTKEDFKAETKEFLENKKAQDLINRKHTQAQLEQQTILNIARSRGLRGALDNVIDFALASLEAEFISQKARASFSALFANPVAVSALIALPIIRGVAKDALSNIELAEGGVVHPTNRGTRLNVNGNNVIVGEGGQAEELTVTPLSQNKRDYAGGGNVGDVYLDGKLVGELVLRKQPQLRRQGRI